MSKSGVFHVMRSDAWLNPSYEKGRLQLYAFHDFPLSKAVIILVITVTGQELQELKGPSCFGETSGVYIFLCT